MCLTYGKSSFDAFFPPWVFPSRVAGRELEPRPAAYARRQGTTLIELQGLIEHLRVWCLAQRYLGSEGVLALTPLPHYINFWIQPGLPSPVPYRLNYSICDILFTVCSNLISVTCFLKIHSIFKIILICSFIFFQFYI